MGRGEWRAILQQVQRTSAEEGAKESAKSKRAKPAIEKGLSSIDAAAQVLSASKEPLNAKQMIEQMAAKALWTSLGGKTPHATL